MKNKKKQLFGRSINGWFLNIKDEDDVMLLDYMIDNIKVRGVKYMIRKITTGFDKEYFEIRVDCSDKMLEFFETIMEDFNHELVMGEVV